MAASKLFADAAVMPSKHFVSEHGSFKRSHSNHQYVIHVQSSDHSLIYAVHVSQN